MTTRDTSAGSKTLTRRETLAALLTKLQVSERRTAAERGEFNLFGLFESDDSAGHFDILAAAPWLPANADGIDMIAHHLPRLVPGETSLIGGIVPIAFDSEFVRDATRFLPDVPAGEVFEMGSARLGDVQIARAYVLAAHRAEAATGKRSPHGEFAGGPAALGPSAGDVPTDRPGDGRAGRGRRGR